jgi:hypothetical protein
MNSIRKRQATAIAVAIATAAVLVPASAIARTSVSAGSPEVSAQTPSHPVGQGPVAGATAGTTATPTQSASAAGTSDGFDWGDAAIGAGVIVALGLTGFGIVALVRHRRSAALSGAPAVIS